MVSLFPRTHLPLECSLWKKYLFGTFFHFVFGTYFLTAKFTEFFLYLSVSGLSFHFSNRAFYRKQKAFNSDEVKFIDFFPFWISFLVSGQRLSQALVLFFS